MEDTLASAIASLERAILSKKSHIHNMQAELVNMERAFAQLQGDANYVPHEVSDEWADVGITEAAMEWLLEVGEPRATREIADAIRDRGVKTRSKNFSNTVYATLKNAKTKFSRTDDGLWAVNGSK